MECGTILFGFIFFIFSLPGLDDRETAAGKLVVGVFGGALFGFLVGYGIDHPFPMNEERRKDDA